MNGLIDFNPILERQSRRYTYYSDRYDEYARLLGSNKTAKSLPYEDWDSWHKMWIKGSRMYQESPVLRSIIEKMISYVVSDKVTYSVMVDRNFADVITDDTLKKVRQAVSATTRDPEWHRMQEASVRRKFRDGEYFRWVKISGGKVKIRFIEPPEIRPDPNEKNEDGEHLQKIFPFGIQYKKNTDGMYDYADPFKYKHHPLGETRTDSSLFTDIPASKIQHEKFGVDENDARGIPLGWMAYCELDKLREVNEAMCELALVQSSFAAVRTYKETARNSTLDAISRGEVDKRHEENFGRPQPGGVIDAKGFELELPGSSVNAGQFVEILAQQFRIIGALLDMPEHISSAEADTGNRSSLISAEGPFDRRVRREQTELGNRDVEVLWKVVENRVDRDIELLQEAIIIAPQFQSAIARDPDAQVDSNLKMVAGKLRSKRTAIAAISGDPDLEMELMSEESEEGLDQDMAAMLAPAQQTPQDPEDAGTGRTGTQGSQ